MAVALGLVLLIGVLWVLGRDQAVEETTATSVLSATTTTAPASALEGIVIYVTDGCSECPLLESRLRGLAGEVPVWVRPADETVGRVPMVVVQFDGRVSARWVWQVAVSHPEAIAAFAGARWPTGTVPTTTTTVPPIESLWASPGTSVAAVSAEEAWAFGGGFDWSGIAHFLDGAWAWAWFVDTLVGTDMPAFVAEPAVIQAVSGLAMAPDGTLWVSGPGGVFSGVFPFDFDGVEWTRRLDYPSGGVAIAPDGTVWIGGDYWLARWDGGSWVPVGPDPQEPPDITGYRGATFCGPRPGVATSDGEVWMVACEGGWGYDFWLLHYDGATLSRIQSDGTTLRDGDLWSGSFLYSWLDVEAAPNGDLWTLMRWHDTGEWLLGRFDGEGWTTYTPPPFEVADDRLGGAMPEAGPAMAVGPDGRVWFALKDGLLAFDGTDWTYHLQGQTVTEVDVAPDGTVWYIDEAGPHTLLTP